MAKKPSVEKTMAGEAKKRGPKPKDTSTEAAEKRKRRNARRQMRKAAQTLAEDAGVERKSGEHATTLTAKAAMTEAFEKLGGVGGLVDWGKKNPAGFYTLWGRLIPKQVDVETGDNLGELIRQLGKPQGSGVAEQPEAIELQPGVDFYVIDEGDDESA